MPSKKQLTGLLYLGLLLLLTNTIVYANGAQLLFKDSPELLWTKLDVIHQGRVFPTTVYPMSVQEFYTSVLREDMTSTKGADNQWIFSFNPSYTGFDVPYTSHGKTVPLSIVYLHDQIPPTAELGSAFSIDDWFHAHLVLDKSPGIKYMTERGSYTLWQENTYANWQFPRESYATVSRPNASLSVGRLPSGIGHGYFGNTALNGQANYYDQLQATYYNERFKFFYLLGSSQSVLTKQERLIQSKGQEGGPSGTYDHPLKMFAYHKVEYQPFDWITLGFGEMNIIGGKYPDFNMINPFGFWHSTFTRHSSNIMTLLDIALVPMPGLHLFGELTVDDVKTSDTDVKPGSVAYQLGAQYVLPLANDIKSVIGAEFTHVDKWTYNRWQPYLTMYQRQIRLPSLYLDIPLGYAYGGDLNHYGLYYKMVGKSGFRTDVNLSRLDKGEIYLGLDDAGSPYYERWQTEDGPQDSPSGIVEQRDMIKLKVTYPLTDQVSVLGSLDYSWINNFQHVTGATATESMVLAGVSWQY